MRTVAKFQLTAPNGAVEIPRQIAAILEKWSGSKFEKTADGKVLIRRSGKDATYETKTETIEDRRRDTYTTLEPVEGGTLQTHIEVVGAADRTALRCTLSIGSQSGVAPTDLSVRAPRFIRDIVALQTPWTIGASGERVFAQSFSVDVDDVSDLEVLMAAPERRLPIVLVSELEGETLAGDLHERLGQDICGLGHTMRLSHEASWELTRRRGKEWSCYNGAIRLLWPFSSNRLDFRNHPLWTLDRIIADAENEVKARDRIRGTVAELIIEASTFVTDDPAFREYEVFKLRLANDQTRAVAAEAGDMQALADAYASENDLLRLRVDDQDAELEDLRARIESLTIALRSTQAVPLQDRYQAPPQTVEEAVEAARFQFGDVLAIAPETDIDIADLNSSAGPPDKILRYLSTLAELANALAAGSLGKALPIWLRDRGVDCSVDSESEKNSKEGKRFRNRIVNGENVECEFHLKPADGVSPDMCARIYFAIADSVPFVKVGYIGRHSD